jgi:transcription termination/antitermination protein NusG
VSDQFDPTADVRNTAEAISPPSSAAPSPEAPQPPTTASEGVAPPAEPAAALPPAAPEPPVAQEVMATPPSSVAEPAAMDQGVVQVDDAAEEPTESVPSMEVVPPAAAPPQAVEPEAAKPKKSKKTKAPEPELPQEPKSENMNWYILKVQSNREDSIREGLLRRVAMEGQGRFFGDVIVPTEKVTEFKGGKKRVIKRKLYPGYLVVNMEINEDTWFLVRDTPGIGDFTGASGHPTPMLPHEVARIVSKQEEKSEKAPKLKIGVTPGERVKINEGTFENFEGEVESIDETNGRVTVMINIFGRSTPVELEYWQIEAV